MLEEALFFVLGGVLTWGYSRVDARRRAAVHAQTREQISELKSVVEETLARIGETRPPSPSSERDPEAGVTAPSGVGVGLASDLHELPREDRVESAPGLEDLGLESALRRLKAHLEETEP